MAAVERGLASPELLEELGRRKSGVLDLRTRGHAFLRISSTSGRFKLDSSRSMAARSRRLAVLASGCRYRAIRYSGRTTRTTTP
jgi:hypothetical protein